jgi:hypothetical protein
MLGILTLRKGGAEFGCRLGDSLGDDGSLAERGHKIGVSIPAGHHVQM